MYKYKYFLLLLCAIAVLLLWFFFPVSFDNNDDQVMYALSSGMFTGLPSPNIILSNIYVGKFLSEAFLFSQKLNWYTLYLQTAQLLSFICICWFFIEPAKNTFLTALLTVLIIFLGFFSVSIVKLQFTTVALFCCSAALLSLQARNRPLLQICSSFFFLALGILIRRDIFFVFLFFSLPLLFTKEKSGNFIAVYISVLLLAVLSFGMSVFVNNTNAEYLKHQTYPNVHALDIIAARPVKVNAVTLKDNNFTSNDIALIQSWLVADDAYLSGKKMEQLALELKTNRNFSEAINELKKFITDERYLLMMYVLTSVIVLVFARGNLNVFIVNLLVFSGFVLYLTIAARIPHRVTFPIITYLILINIGLFLESPNRPSLKTSVLSLLLFLSGYKFSCTAKLYPIHQENQAFFDACRNEINAHPESLFIASDGFPLQHMDAWQTAEKNFPFHNLILGGWYACSPDYQVVLKLNRLGNLTSDLRTRDKVYFLTNSMVLQESYIKVMRERYDINCHFEEQTPEFQALKPKRLVFDN